MDWLSLRVECRDCGTTEEVEMQRNGSHYDWNCPNCKYMNSVDRDAVLESLAWD